MLIDTHCHLDSKDFALDQAAVIEQAKQAGIGFMINVATDLLSCHKTLSLIQQYPEIFGSIGIHPHFAKDITKSQLAEAASLSSRDKIVAIGETGLDYYRNISPPQKQAGLFEYFIELAIRAKKPLIIHCRQAQDAVLKILDKYANDLSKVVMHCFSGGEAFLRECLERGYFISFAGNLTYRDAPDLAAAAKITPAERLLVETDAPYLAPGTNRGKRNEPANLVDTAREVARLKGLSFADVARISVHNSRVVFKIGEVAAKGAIAYAIRDALYLNITNRCTNRCSFCVRNATDFVKGHNLKLEHEPSREEIIAAIGDPKRFKEVVFCGVGEPLLRLETVLAVAHYLKQQGMPVRLNTNGEANLIHKRNIVPELAKMIDAISISLNAPDAAAYNEFCRSQFGDEAFPQVIAFIKECKKFIPRVSVTAVNIPGVDIDGCRCLAERLGVKFRLREYNEAG